jgi:hypothetical protein
MFTAGTLISPLSYTYDKGDIKVPAVNIEKFHSEQKGLRNYDEIIDVNQKLNKNLLFSIDAETSLFNF